MNAHLPVLLLTLFTPLAAIAATDVHVTTAIPVSGIQLAGLAPGETLAEAAILDLDLTLALTADGYIAPHPGVPSWSLRLRDLRTPFGTRAMLEDSAIQALVERIRQAHDEHGRDPVRVSVEPELLAQLREPGADGVLVIHVTPSVSAEPAAEPPVSASAFSSADHLLSDTVLGTVRSVSFRISGDGAPAENDLLALTVELGWDEDAIPAGHVATRRGLPVREVALWEIGGPARAGTPLYGSAIRSLLEQVRTALVERGHADTEVWLSREALHQLSHQRSDGLLEIEVATRPAGS